MLKINYTMKTYKIIEMLKVKQQKIKSLKVSLIILINKWRKFIYKTLTSL